MTPSLYRTQPQSGYALLAVLWICMAVASSTLLCLAAAREAVATSRNRGALVQSDWEAQGCLERAMAAIARAEKRDGNGRAVGGVPAWQRVDRLLATTDVGRCEMTVMASGSRLDIHTTDETILWNALRKLGLPEPAADSVAAAILDWIDPDDIARPFGAESKWYRERGLTSPANRRLIDIRELNDVRGVGEALEIGKVFTAESGVPSLGHAPIELLELLPGFTGDIAHHVAVLRTRGVHFESFDDLAIGLPAPVRTALQDALPELARVATLQPSSWVITAVHRQDASAPGVVIDIRIERIGGQIVVVRRRARTV